MSDLDYSFLGYLLNPGIPATLLKSVAKELSFSDKQVESVVRILAERLPDEATTPDSTTTSSLVGAIKHGEAGLVDVVREAAQAKRLAGDIQGYIILFKDRERSEKADRLQAQMQKAMKDNNENQVYNLARQLVSLRDEARYGISKPNEFDELLDIDSLVAPENMIVTSIPRVNQHLGGDPYEIDCEDTGGVAYGEITVIGGYTNAGKSALNQTFFFDCLSQVVDNEDCKCAYINYEVRWTLFKKTVFAMATGTWPDISKASSKYMRTASEEWERFITPRKGAFTIYDSNVPYTTMALEEELNKLAHNGHRVAFIDTINSIDNQDSSKKHEEIERTLVMLERVAKRHDMAIIVTAQNKQGLQFEEDKWPELKWIGQSAAIQQKTGAALGIYRADIYSGGALDYTTLAVMKLRHRTPLPKEGIRVSYDKFRRMYVPYSGSETSINEAPSLIRERQALTMLNGTQEVAFLV